MREWFPRLILIAILVGLFVFGYGIYRAIRAATLPMAGLGSDLATNVAEIIHPTPTIYPDPVTVIREVQSLTRLETAQYSIEKVITAEAGQDALAFLFGDKLLFVAHGTVIAGVDFGKMAPTDLRVDAEGRAYVVLPDPEIFVATLDNEKSYVYDRQTGLLTRGNINLETQARQVAEDAIQDAALEDGILELARTNARNYIERLLQTVGYTEAVFISPTPLPSGTPSG